MLRETLGTALLGAALVGAPATTATAAEGSVASATTTTTAATTTAVRREALTVRIDTQRIRRDRGRVEITVREARSRERVRGIRACLQWRFRGDWRTFDCEFTDRRGKADWFVDSRRTYRIFIPGTRDYFPYFSERFRFRGFGEERGRGRGRG